MSKASLRTIATENKYLDDKQQGKLIPLHEEEHLKDFKYWFLVDNKYPYDVAFKTHHLLLPNRKVPSRNDLLMTELQELMTILSIFDRDYDIIFENTLLRRSVTGHFHIHLAIFHDSRSEMRSVHGR